jgi:hypothetical protein
VRPEPSSSDRPSLASVQKAVMALITGRDVGLSDPGADALIASDARASADERMRVYAHMYRARIIEALESQFPRVAKLLGADAFGALAAAYIGDEPSRHPSLRHVGEHLPAWLQTHRPESPPSVGLAALEWARADVFDVADEATLTLDGVRSWPMDRFGELPLRLVTAHRLLTVAAGTAKLWDALGGDPVDGGTAPPDGSASESVMVWREGTVVFQRLVGESERAALALASHGTRFGVVCESLLATYGEEAAVAQAHGWMSTWLADGLLRSA